MSRPCFAALGPLAPFALWAFLVGSVDALPQCVYPDPPIRTGNTVPPPRSGATPGASAPRPRIGRFTTPGAQAPTFVPPGSTPALAQLWEPQRGPSARELLTIDWQFPVHATASRDAASTSARLESEALERAAAFRAVAADDPRPLLILRECSSCSGTDDALLSRSKGNERTVLLSRWFRCVKLPANVLEERHPFRGLFAEERPAHLFVARADGSELVALRGDQSRRELWKVLEGRLTREYRERPGTAVKKLFQLLDRYDLLDERRSLLGEELETTIEDRGPTSSKVAKLRGKLVQLEREYEALVDAWTKAAALQLVQPGGPHQASQQGL